MKRLKGLTRSSNLSLADSRQAWLATAGIANWVTSARRLAGIAPCCSLAARMASCMASSRSAGSDRLVGRGASIIDTLLPIVPFWSVARTETGTAATNGADGNELCSASQRRRAPAHSAMTTSLTVRSLPALRRLTSASGRSVKAHLRCADSGALKGVPGACSPVAESSSSLSLPGRRPASEGPIALASPGIDRARSATTRTACSG